MKEINIFDFKKALINFDVKRIESASVVWIKNNNKLSHEELFLKKENFKFNYAFAVEHNLHFEEISFSSEVKKQVFAEIYPSGSNAGGSRVATDRLIQIKGVGSNMLVGFETDRWHSYGGLSLFDAVIEVINSNIADSILPLGTANCLGIIATGKKTALQPNGKGHTRGPGALLIRKAVLRPVHFLEVKNFTPLPVFDHVNLNEPERTKENILKLVEVLGGEAGISRLLHSFVTGHAMQLSCSKVNCFYHGSLSQSNISLTGEWIDLTTASFVYPGNNYRSNEKMLTFYEEHCSVVQLLNVLLKQISVFTNYNFDVDYYTKKFSEEMMYFARYYSGEIIGIPRDVLEKVPQGLLDDILNLVWPEIISSNLNHQDLPVGTVVGGSVFKFLKRFFCTSVHQEFCRVDVTSLDKVSLKICKELEKEKSFKFSLCSLKKSLAIRAFRRCVFSVILFRKNIEYQLQKIINDSDAIEIMIEQYSNTTSWMFNSNDLLAPIIFSNNFLIIKYDCESELFFIKNENFELSGDFSFLHSWILSESNELFHIVGFDCKDMVLSLLSAELLQY